MWFDVRVFNPFRTVWNAFVIQDESVLGSCSSFSILADSNKY